MWIRQHHSVHALDVGTIIVFVNLGLQFNWNQLSANKSRHRSCIIRGCMQGSDLTEWCPNQMLLVHWVTIKQTTLEPHWLMYHPVVFQWQSSGNLHNCNTLEDHWKATGRPLETHCLPTILPSVASQCTLGSKFQPHWIATELPLAHSESIACVNRRTTCYLFKALSMCFIIRYLNISPKTRTTTWSKWLKL